MAEQAERFSQQQRGNRFRPGLEGEQHTLLDVQNTSGAHAELGHVLGLGAPLRTPAVDPNSYREANAILATTPDLVTHRYEWVVLAQDLVAGEVGVGVLIGCVWCTVVINSTAHRFATLLDGDATQLDSYWWGRGRILWQPGSTGPQTCLVELGGYSHGVKYAGTVATPGSAKGDTCTVNVGSDTIAAVYNRFADIDEDKAVHVCWVQSSTPGDGPEIDAAECPMSS